MAQIAVQKVHKSFKSDAVLNDVSLSAEKGEIVVVFGPSGTGKTVLLRLIVGIEEPDAGAIYLQGRDVTTAAPEQRAVGMAFQNFALFPHMTAFDNIASALTAKETSKETIKAKFDKVAKLLKITHVLQHAPRELSNGQKQRTALARALVADPPVLLLDDPLRNVDAKLRYEMRLELPSLLKTSGSTVIYVTQDYKEAMALGDKIAVLLDGNFAQIASPAEIYREPATLGVARLFGDPTLNIIETEPTLRGNTPLFKIGHSLLSLPSSFSHIAGKPCILGIRPEAISVGARPSDESFPVDVVAVTPLNEKSVLLLRTEDGHEILASEAGNEDGHHPQGTAFAKFNGDSVLVFDAATGRRIAPQTH